MAESTQWVQPNETIKYENLKSKFLKRTALFFAIICLLLFACNQLISTFAKPYLYSNVADIPSNKVGLLLGTSRLIGNGAENPFFNYRIQAAAQLYKAGKIKYIIASGDNGHEGYNEPDDMKNSLLQQGIPDSAIVLDYAGFRTFDSILRCKEIFSQQNFTIISQPFHNERAVFIAQKNGLNAIAFNAHNVAKSQGLRTQVREVFARSKAMLDIYLLNTKPKFGGQKINLK